MSQRIPFAYQPGGPPNTKKYPFFIDDKLNKVIPPWFVTYDRDEAERKLARNYPNQNVMLMRVSTTSAQFVITAQTVSKGRTFVDHYGVQNDLKKGFYIDINSRHGSTKTLSEIVEVFLKLTEPTIYKIFNLTSSNQPTSSSGQQSIATKTVLRSSSITESPTLRTADFQPGVLSNQRLRSPSIPSNKNGVYLTPTSTAETPAAVSRASRDDYVTPDDSSNAGMNGDYITTNYSDASAVSSSGANANGVYLTPKDSNISAVPSSGAIANGDYLTPKDIDAAIANDCSYVDYGNYADVQNVSQDISSFRLSINQQNQPIVRQRTVPEVPRGPALKPPNRSRSE